MFASRSMPEKVLIPVLRYADVDGATVRDVRLRRALADRRVIRASEGHFAKQHNSPTFFTPRAFSELRTFPERSPCRVFEVLAMSACGERF